MRYGARAKRKGKGKRSKDKGFIAFVNILEKQHWSFNLAGAVTSYLALCYIQDKPAVSLYAFGLLKPIIIIATYLLPFIFVVGVFASVIWSRRRQKLLRDIQRSKCLEQALRKISWQEFELVVGQLFRSRGYAVEEGKLTRDGGVDLWLRKDAKLHLVQCKHWSKSGVGVGVVRELFGVMSLFKAESGFVICSGKFTRDAEAFAKQVNIELIGIHELEKYLFP